MKIPSYEAINYSLRPAKAIERKMLCELFQRLSFFNKLEDYQYIGFGSLYFSDFFQIHRSLGINNLTSIEKEDCDKKRFIFNVPYSCINLKFGHSNEILSTLSFDKTPTILWLDYDYQLNHTVLDDIRTFISSAFEGSVIIITVNAQPYNCEQKCTPEELKADRLKKLIENVGETKIPVGIDGSELNLRGLSQIYRQIINDEITTTTQIRNNGKKDLSPQKIIYNQLVNFEYKDGAKILSVGGIIYSEYQKEKLSNSNFNHLDFYKNGESPFEIKVPNLTYREIYQLESLLPSGIDLSTGDILSEDKILQDGIKNITEIIPLKDVINYSEIYRYFPFFRESTI